MSLEEQFAEVLHRAAHGWRTALDRRLRPHGLSRSTWMILLHVSREAGITQSALAERLGIEAPTLVRQLDRMEREGILLRRSIPSDRRIKQLLLTESGQEIVGRIWENAAILRSEILHDLPVDELEITLRTLQRIRSKLESAL